MITIKVNKAPTLPICKMNCDTKLHNKLDEFELTKHLNSHSTNLILGKPGSGKTNLLYQLFKSKKLMNKVFDKIILFQPLKSRESMKDPLFNQLPDNQKFDELTSENLELAEDQLDEGNNCIIFDDMGAFLKDKEIRTQFKKLIYNRRHNHLTIFFLVQTWYSVEKDIRKLFSNIFVFRVNKKELETIFDEVIEKPKDLITELSAIVYDKPYNFLFINTDTGKLFKNFDELIIK